MTPLSSRASPVTRGACTAGSRRRDLAPRSFGSQGFRRLTPVLIVLAVFAGVLGITDSFGLSSTITGKPAATSVAAEMNTLLNEGNGYTAKGYFEKTSSTLVAAAAGAYNSKFYDLGKYLVRDGFGDIVIDLGREMNGKWYEWSQHRAPPSEPEPGNKPYQLAEYPDAVAALKQGTYPAGSG